MKRPYDEVLDSVKHDATPPAVLVTHSAQTEPDSTPIAEPAPLAADGSNHNNHNDNGNAPAQSAPEEVRLHRPLIRAQLPRIEREPAARPVPEFTIRQANKNRGRFQNNSRPGRFAKSGGQGGNSRGPGGPHGRPGGRPQGPGSQMRSRPNGQHQQGPKKRTR